MPRGRPKKNPLPSTEQNPSPIPSNPTPSPKSKKQYPLCSRCHKEITSTNPFRINLSYLTSVASYHRQVSDDTPILCFECARGLSDTIDKFLISGGAKKKFEQSEGWLKYTIESKQEQ